MEHLSRRTTNNVDYLCIVAEPTAIGSVTARRISGLAEKLPIGVRQIGVIWNKESDKIEYCLINGIETFGHIPYDKIIFESSTKGKTVFELSKDNPAYSAVGTILERMLALSPHT